MREGLRKSRGSGRHRLDALLVERQLPHGENLGIGYLLAALRGGGLRAESARLNTCTDFELVAQRIRQRRPRLVGLAMSDAAHTPLALGLGDHLRTGGYRGHITAGGPFATLARHWLLERYPWLDSVIRFAGELPIVELAQAIVRGAPWDQSVGGLTTRAGDGPPAPVLSPLPLELRPARDHLPEILGVRIAHVSAARGCRGRCAYCGPAALQELERHEVARCNEGQPLRSAATVNGVRRRSPENLADEMAELWHERQVRYFCFVDEQLLPRRESDALYYLRRWRGALAARGLVCPPVSCMLRADQITEPVLDALCDLGLTRCLVALELLSRSELRMFGRGGDPHATITLLRRLEKRGVATVCNAMLVHPRSTEATIASGLELLDGMADLPYEATQMQVYHGTELHRELAQAGRITGNPLWCEYTIDDPVAERYAAISCYLTSTAEAYEGLSSHIRDLRLALGMAERLVPATRLSSVRRSMARLVRETNELRSDVRHRTLEQARRHDPSAMRQLAVAADEQATRLRDRLDTVWERLRTRSAFRGQYLSPTAAAATSAITYVVLTGAGSAACSPGAPVAAEPAPPLPSVTSQSVVRDADSTVGPTRADAEASADADGTPDDGGAPPGPRTGLFEHGAWAEVPATKLPTLAKRDASTPIGKRLCATPTLEAATVQKVQELIARHAPCKTIWLEFPPGRRINLYFNVVNVGREATGHWQGYVVPSDNAHQYELRDLLPLARAVATELSPEELQCVANRPWSAAELAGEDASEVRTAVKKLSNRCMQDARLLVKIDAEGAIADVLPEREGAATAGMLVCVRRALRGLRFPCNQSRQLRLNYVVQRPSHGWDFI